MALFCSCRAIIINPEQVGSHTASTVSHTQPPFTKTYLTFPTFLWPCGSFISLIGTSECYSPPGYCLVPVVAAGSGVVDTGSGEPTRDWRDFSLPLGVGFRRMGRGGGGQLSVNSGRLYLGIAS